MAIHERRIWLGLLLFLVAWPAAAELARFTYTLPTTFRTGDLLPAPPHQQSLEIISLYCTLDMFATDPLEVSTSDPAGGLPPEFIFIELSIGEWDCAATGVLKSRIESDFSNISHRSVLPPPSICLDTPGAPECKPAPPTNLTWEEPKQGPNP